MKPVIGMIGMKCIVTGGAGFIGGHLIDDLVSGGHDVISYDIVSNHSTIANRKFRSIKADVRDITTLRSIIQDADYVFHLAGILGTEELFSCPAQAIEINVIGALNVLQAAKDVATPDCTVFLAAKPNEWNNIYSVTSQAVEKLGLTYAEFLGLDVRMLRLRTVYGPTQRVDGVVKVVPSLITNALKNTPIPIFGTGTDQIELQFVGDVAKIIITYAFSKEKVVDPTHELITANVISVLDLASLIIGMTNSSSKINYLPRRIGEGSTRCFHRSKNVADFVTLPRMTPLTTGLKKTIHAYKFASERRIT